MWTSRPLWSSATRCGTWKRPGPWALAPSWSSPARAPRTLEQHADRLGATPGLHQPLRRGGRHPRPYRATRHGIRPFPGLSSWSWSLSIALYTIPMASWVGHDADWVELPSVPNGPGSTCSRCGSSCAGLDYRVTGPEHLPRTNTIVLCKHQSTWETISLLALMPRPADLGSQAGTPAGTGVRLEPGPIQAHRPGPQRRAQGHAPTARTGSPGPGGWALDHPLPRGDPGGGRGAGSLRAGRCHAGRAHRHGRSSRSPTTPVYSGRAGVCTSVPGSSIWS